MRKLRKQAFFSGQSLRTGGLQNTKLLDLSDPQFVVLPLSFVVHRQITKSLESQFCHILVCYAGVHPTTDYKSCIAVVDVVLPTSQ